MTSNSAEKRAARAYSRQNHVSYRTALAMVRNRQSDTPEHDLFGQRLLIEAIEGCGIRHWAHVDEWDGESCAVITDVGGESYRLTVDNVMPGLVRYLREDAVREPLEIDSYIADEVIQTALFGHVIYRSVIRRRPTMVAPIRTRPQRPADRVCRSIVPR